MRRSINAGMPLKGKIALVLILMGLSILGYNIGSLLFEKIFVGDPYDIENYKTVVTATITSIDADGIRYKPDSGTLDGYKNMEFLLKTKGVCLFDEKGNRVSLSRLSKDDRLFLLIGSDVLLKSDPPQLDVFKPIVVLIR